MYVAVVGTIMVKIQWLCVSVVGRFVNPDAVATSQVRTPVRERLDWTWENLICDNRDTFDVRFSAKHTPHLIQ